MRRRAALEPVIGHMKAKQRLGRNHLNGRDGDWRERFSPALVATPAGRRLLNVSSRTTRYAIVQRQLTPRRAPIGDAATASCYATGVAIFSRRSNMPFLTMRRARAFFAGSDAAWYAA
jgi:hypothetical protein